MLCMSSQNLVGLLFAFLVELEIITPAFLASQVFPAGTCFVALWAPAVTNLCFTLAKKKKCLDRLLVCHFSLYDSFVTLIFYNEAC